MRIFAAFALSLVGACTAVPLGPTPDSQLVTSLALPPMKTFAQIATPPPTRPNSQIAQDFIELSFLLESGRELPVLTRFEGPITVRVTGDASATLMAELQALLARLRNEAGIDISLIDGRQANITVEAVSAHALERVAPNAACFVVPRISRWNELRAAQKSNDVDWTTLAQRDRVAIFVPANAPPQETRDCLHEELAQALGPLNDLYRLPDSVFNDDNIHTVLTGFDMLILRTYYAPELKNGMTRDEVTAKLPGLLARLNPNGQRGYAKPTESSSREWVAAMEVALTSRGSAVRRISAAERAIIIGSSMGWSGPREGFAHYVYGQLQIGRDPEIALAAFNSALRAYQQSPDTRIHVAHVAVQHLAFTLSSGDAAQTSAIADTAIPVAAAHQNAALLSLLMMFKAEALDMQGDSDAATALRLDSLGWARYGFGDDRNVLARLNEIASLRPR